MDHTLGASLKFLPSINNIYINTVLPSLPPKSQTLYNNDFVLINNTFDLAKRIMSPLFKKKKKEGKIDFARINVFK